MFIKIKRKEKNHSIINPRSINKNQHGVTFYNKIPLLFVVNLFITFCGKKNQWACRSRYNK